MFLKLTGGGCVGALVMLAINAAIGGLCVQYVGDFWLTFLKCPAPCLAPIHLSFWPCALLGLFMGQFFVPAALITWLIHTAGAV